jgi:hypothetical protein
MRFVLVSDPACGVQAGYSRRIRDRVDDLVQTPHHGRIRDRSDAYRCPIDPLKVLEPV